MKGKAPRAYRGEYNMEDFPLWLKLIVWATIGLTVVYTAVGIVRSIMAT
jgi:hypothetical protein